VIICEIIVHLLIIVQKLYKMHGTRIKIIFSICLKNAIIPVLDVGKQGNKGKYYVQRQNEERHALAITCIKRGGADCPALCHCSR